MREGKQRKRLIKLARRCSIEQVRLAVQPLSNKHPIYCVVRSNGFDLIRGWGKHGMCEVTIDDEVASLACEQYLEMCGLVFDSEEQAIEYGRRNGLIGE